MSFPHWTIVILLAAATVPVGLAAQTATPANKGADLLQSGRLSDARDAFEALLSANPGDTEAQAGEVETSERIALEARGKGQMDDALRALLRAQDFAPKSPRLLFDLGMQEEEMHLFLDADKSLTAVEQLTPADAKVLYGLARVKMDLGQLVPAEEKMQAYLKLRPSDASAHFGLGRIYQIGLQFEQARAEFQRSVELQPVQTESYYELGDLALKQGDFEDAIAKFSKTLARDPKHGGALEGTGEALFKQKQYEKARVFLEQAIAVAPDYAPCHLYLGRTLARLDRKEDSERELALAAKLANEENRRASKPLQLIKPSAQQ